LVVGVAKKREKWGGTRKEKFNRLLKKGRGELRIITKEPQSLK